MTLNSTGSAVEFTTKASTNTLVTRFSIPDAPGGGGLTATLNVYVNGQFLKPITLTSKHAWLYGPEAGPGNNPGAGGPRHIYDEASLLLGTTVPAGSKIKLQKDAANSSQYAIDFVNFEQVAPRAHPDPARYAVPAGFTHQDVQNALDKVRMATTGTLTGVYLPAGDYATATKFQVYGKAVDVVGAGVWFTRFTAPANQENTDIGFRAVQRRARQGFRLLEPGEPDHRRPLGGAPDVPALGVEHGWHQGVELADPGPVRRRAQLHQRQHRQPHRQQRGPVHR